MREDFYEPVGDKRWRSGYDRLAEHRADITGMLRFDNQFYTVVMLTLVFIGERAASSQEWSALALPYIGGGLGWWAWNNQTSTDKAEDKIRHELRLERERIAEAIREELDAEGGER